MLDHFVAILLGLVEGLTEFVPVSSTGHLIVVGELLGFTGEKASTFEIFIQLGAILAVVMLYFKYFLGLLDFSAASSGGAGFRGFSGLSKLAVGALPVMIVGFLAHKHIKEHLFSSQSVAVGLFMGAILMLIADKPASGSGKQNISEVSYRDCLIVGMAQCFALWPGVSRSGATIIGGLWAGFSRRLAAEFSFILAVPVMTIACVYELYKNIGLLTSDDLIFFAVGFVVSWLVAMLAIKVLMKVLQTWSFRPFALYRIAIAALIILLWR